MANEARLRNGLGQITRGTVPSPRHSGPRQPRGPGDHGPKHLLPVCNHPWCWDRSERSLKISRGHLVQPPISRQDTSPSHRHIQQSCASRSSTSWTWHQGSSSACLPSTSSATYSKAHLTPLCSSYYPRGILSIIQDMIFPVKL